MATSDVEEYFAFVERVTVRLAEMVGGADVDALGRYKALCDHLTDVMRAGVDLAVQGLLTDPDYPAKLSDIAEALGVTTSAASKRFKHVPKVRRQGGQPGQWR